MDDLLRLRAWTHARQRLGRAARTAGEALRDVVGVYSVHPTAPLALAARTRGLTAEAFRRLDRRRTALRLPAMRGTVFLVRRGDAPGVFTAAAPAPELSRRLGRHGITVARYRRIARRIEREAREPRTPADLREIADLSGPELASVLRCMRAEGSMLAVGGDSLRADRLRYVATSAWFPPGLQTGDREAALAWLAGRYLRAYGPVRVEDLAWWAGVPKRAAEAALSAHRTVEVGGGLLLPASQARAFERTRPLRDAVDLLPKWDAYTMGHAPDGRERFVHPDVQQRLYTPLDVGLPGDGQPVVLVEGEAVALWSLTAKRGPAVMPFERLGARLRARVDEELERAARLISA